MDVDPTVEELTAGMNRVALHGVGDSVLKLLQSLSSYQANNVERAMAFQATVNRLNNESRYCEARAVAQEAIRLGVWTGDGARYIPLPAVSLMEGES